MSPIDFHSEVRHMPKQVVSELGNILQIDYSWKDIMGLIPDNPWVPGKNFPIGNYPKKYSADQIRLVDDECSKDGRTGLEVLVEEWGTSGIMRPKVSDLIHLLTQAGLERASEYLKRLTFDDTGYSTSNQEMVISSEIAESGNENCMNQNTNSEQEVWEEFKCNSTPFIPHKDFRLAIENGTKIGQGAFGFVYKADLSVDGIKKVVAIKVLTECDKDSKQLLKKEKVFQNELNILSICDHKNIVTLEGYSFSASELGLVYSFMKNGSLFDRLSCSDNSTPLPWKLRLNIGEGTAEAIVYLHTKFNPPLVHRDVKSQNILLDENLVPKLGDFGIVRHGSQARHSNTVVITTAIGTQMYMAPEAFRGDVSVKMDTFSFGIVILELLTGLPYYDEKQGDILSLVENYEENIIELLDASAGNWDELKGKKMFEFAELCTKEKKERPDMVHALSLLRNIIYANDQEIIL